MATPVVQVRGDGIAAYCCTHLLRKAGVDVQLVRPDRARVPALLISEAALHLLRDIFASPDLLSGNFVIRERIVAWQAGQGVARLPHLGYVTSEAELLASLVPPGAEPPSEAAPAPDWVIYSSNPLPEGVGQMQFGSRAAVAYRVRLRESCPPGACMMESLPAGWLFLLPNAADAAWLLAVGDAAQDPLALSRVVAPHIAGIESSSKPFPSHPRIATQLAGERWLACGSAAMAFDPICGDGTALAVRAAILAAAVVRAHLDGHDTDLLRAHYEGRIRAGFQRHMELCRQYYLHSHGGAWWERELSALDTYSAQPTPQFRYMLRGFSLELISG